MGIPSIVQSARYSVALMISVDLMFDKYNKRWSEGFHSTGVCEISVERRYLQNQP